MVTDVEFSSLGLESVLLRAISDLGFQFCTPIQAESLPALLEGRDVAGQAQTGTGKTAAYLLAILQKLLSAERAGHRNDTVAPTAVIVAPTRELAIQIYGDAEALARDTGLRLGLVYGGTDSDKQCARLAGGVDILIGTPGRLIDFLKQKVFHFRRVQAVVLDEADRMFDLGFIRDIRYLLRRMPEPVDRLNMLFSATLSHRVLELAYEDMGDPIQVRINPEQITAEKVRQTLYHVSKDEKMALLLGLFRSQPDAAHSLVFVNTRRGAQWVSDCLCSNRIGAALISGDVPQKQRERVLRRFIAGQIDVLVTTDVAARGLHIPRITHVINYDLPQNAEDYVHRIGRTARAGASGDAISLACEEYVFSLLDIEACIGHAIPVLAVQDTMLVQPVWPRKRSGNQRHGSSFDRSSRIGRSPGRSPGEDSRHRRASGQLRST